MTRTLELVRRKPRVPLSAETKAKNLSRMKKWVEDFKAKAPKAYEVWKKERLEYTKRRRLEKREYYLWESARSRAKKKGIDFTIEVCDICIPDRCPVLGVKFELRGPSAYGPSLDRIDPKGGYTPDNIVVVSRRVNTAKAQLTVDELVKMADFYKRLLRRK